MSTRSLCDPRVLLPTQGSSANHGTEKEKKSLHREVFWYGHLALLVAKLVGFYFPVTFSPRFR
jgi:hypothetical protein